MQTSPAPSPALFMETINAYQKSAALKAALDLEVFTHIGQGGATAAAVASRCGAQERGVRILCDYLTVLGFLTKAGDRYALTPDSALFLDRQSPAYLGSSTEFFLAREITAPFEKLTEAVRAGGTASTELGTTAPEHPVWIHFARAMGPMMRGAAQGMADVLPVDPATLHKILDVSASHGAWGIALAQRAPAAQLVALDWEPVLAVTRENARAAGVTDRLQTIAGDAFTADLGTDYDVILVPNFLHHFDPPTCVRFLQRVHAALRPGGLVAIAEFVPNDDRVTPPAAAGFSLVMLATTPAGDAYTFAELAVMLSGAGFSAVDQRPIPASPATAVFGTKPA